MKSNSKITLLLAGLGALVWAGCQMQYPSSYSRLGSSAGVVLNFDSPWSSPQTVATAQSPSGPLTDVTGAAVTELSVNPTLVEANKQGSTIVKAGTIVPTGSPLVVPSFVGPGANNTPYCVHMAVTFVDPANGSYPAAMLSIPLEASGNGYYDASFFSGIKFYIKTAGDDAAGNRSFAIPVAQTTVPSSGGTCNPSAASNACYNNFQYLYPATNGNWQLVTLPFTSLTRGNYGSAITPTTLSGANLQQIISLQWSEGNQNVAGTVVADYYVDEIQFF